MLIWEKEKKKYWLAVKCSEVAGGYRFGRDQHGDVLAPGACLPEGESGALQSGLMMSIPQVLQVTAELHAL